MRTINCAVVDDEPIAREGIREFIENIDFLKFRGFAKDAESTLKLLETTPIDLLFIDIRMPGISGIDFIKTITEKKPLFVFVTAYPDFALESYDLDSLDYLMKPVSFSRFKVTAERALRVLSPQAVPSKPKDFFFVKSEGRMEKINVPEIVYVASLQNYVRIYLSNGQSHIVHSTLKNFNNQLDLKKFIMVHKCYIVHTDFIHSISGNQVNLKGFGTIPIGRIFKPNIANLLLKN